MKYLTKDKRFTKLHFRPVFYGFVALLLGLFFARDVVAGNIMVILTLLLIAAIVVCLCCYFNCLKRLLFLTLVFIFGFGLFFAGEASFMGKTYNQPANVSGKIADGITDKGDYNIILLKKVYINGKSARNIRVFIYKNAGEGYEAGNIITFKTDVRNVKLFELGSINTYALRDNAPYTASVGDDEITVDIAGITLSESLRANIKDLMNDNMSSDAALLAYASLFGETDGIGESIYNDFLGAGLLHLIAVSGLHVVFLAAILNFILKRFKVNRVVNFIVIAAILLLYTSLCSFVPSMVRSSIMYLVFLGSKLSKRKYDPLNSLGLSGIIILVFSPLSALDYGFLMSFACVFAIFTVGAPLNRWFCKVMPPWLAGTLAMSIASQIGVLPFMANFFSVFNFLTVFANLLLIPLFGIMFTLLFVFMLICLALPFMGFLFYPVNLLINLILIYAHAFASAKAFQFALEPFNVVLSVCLLVSIFIMSYILMVSKRARVVLLSGMFALVSVVTVCFLKFPKRETTFAALGSYSSTTYVISSAGGKNLLVGDSSRLARVYLSQKGPIEFDAVLLFNNNGLDSSSADYLAQKGVEKVFSLLPWEYASVVESDLRYRFSDFAFKFITVSGELIGVEVEVDGKIIFISNGSYNLFAYNPYKSYNIVCVAGITNVIPAFDADMIVSTYGDPDSDVVTGEVGSFSLALDEINASKIRRLD